MSLSARRVIPGGQEWTSADLPTGARERFLRSVWPASNGCLEPDRFAQPGRYSQFYWRHGGKGYRPASHRVAWVIRNGDIPVGMEVHHKCFNPKCVNPDHLALLTKSENARRNAGEDWPVGTCRHGHPNSEFLMTSEGIRRCRTCRKKQFRDYYLRKKARMGKS